MIMYTVGSQGIVIRQNSIEVVSTPERPSFFLTPPIWTVEIPLICMGEVTAL